MYKKIRNGTILFGVAFICAAICVGIVEALEAPMWVACGLAILCAIALYEPLQYIFKK